MSEPNGHNERPDPTTAARAPAAKPKRFYTTAAFEAAPGDTQGFIVTLDRRTAKTPGGRPLLVLNVALAEAVAAEWQAQVAVIDPATMPLTRLVNTVIDGVAGREAEVAADVVKYAGSDLVCYRAEAPPGLVERQAHMWDPVVAHAERRIGAALHVTAGLMPVAQPEAVGRGLAALLHAHDAFAIAALHVMTTLTGSALIAFACLERAMSAEAAWAAAHVDEDWQIAQWGEDAEAAARRRRRWQEMAAADRLVALLSATEPAR